MDRTTMTRNQNVFYITIELTTATTANSGWTIMIRERELLSGPATKVALRILQRLRIPFPFFEEQAGEGEAKLYALHAPLLPDAHAGYA